MQRPQNLLFTSRSPSRFHPEPSQCAAKTVGWCTTFSARKRNFLSLSTSSYVSPSSGLKGLQVLPSEAEYLQTEQRNVLSAHVDDRVHCAVTHTHELGPHPEIAKTASHARRCMEPLGQVAALSRRCEYSTSSTIFCSAERGSLKYTGRQMRVKSLPMASLIMLHNETDF